MNRGFTLVELLVAMALLGFLTVLLFGGLRFGTRVWDSAQQNQADDKALRAAELLLRDAITRAYPMPVYAATQTMHVDFDGEAQSLTCLVAATENHGGMTRLHVGAVPHGEGLALEVSTSGELDAPPVSRTRRLLDEIDALEFSYLGRRAGEKAARWADDWRDQPSLPRLVRIRARMRDRRLIWPDLVVAPRIVADVGCTLDALTHDCAGR